MAKLIKGLQIHHQMKRTYMVHRFSSGMHYILLDQSIMDELPVDNNKRAVCRLNNSTEIHCALMKKKEGGYNINIGSGICRKLQIQAGSMVTASFHPDETRYQFDMPEEFQEVLDTDPEANAVFHTLTDGNKRSLIYLVAKVKSGEKRIEKSLLIANRLKSGITAARQML